MGINIFALFFYFSISNFTFYIVANEIPFECQVGNHQTLQGDHRLFTSSNSPFDDSQLAIGWYRFKDGQQMKEDQNIPKELGLSVSVNDA